MTTFTLSFRSAFWAEVLKARRSKVSWLTTGSFLIMPVITGLLIFILKDPEQAQEMGLISIKAQLAGATGDWPTYFGMLTMGVGVAGSILFAIITSWVFGREFSDHTVKEWLALPTPRGIIIGAKFVLVALWIIGIALLVFGIGLVVGAVICIPGWSPELVWTSFKAFMLTSLLSCMLMSCVALFASVGRGYLLPIGWAFLTMALAQIASLLGWAEWFPWAVPGLVGGSSGLAAQPVGLHSYAVVAFAFLTGIVATLIWWQRADQTK